MQAPPLLTPHQAQARFYMLPRAFEALRQRGACADRLAAELFPFDAATSKPYALAHQMLAGQRAAVFEGASLPAPGDSVAAPTEATPLFIRGQAVDRFVDDELLATLHAMRRALARQSRQKKSSAGGTGGGGGRGLALTPPRPPLQVVDLGKYSSNCASKPDSLTPN